MNYPSNISNYEYRIKTILSVKNLKWSKAAIEESLYRNFHRTSDLLVFITEGSANYIFDEKDHFLSAGDVVYLSRGCNYFRPVSSKSYSAIFIDFDFDTPEKSVLPCEAFKKMQSLDTRFLKLYNTWRNKETSHYSECMGILYGIYSRLIRSKADSYVTASKRALFDNVIKRMAECSESDDVSVSELAKESEMSEVHFRRLFKKLYKCSPRQYVIDLKIERAKELLRCGAISITDAASLSGFADSCYFSRIFKSKTGYTPSEYKVKFEV